MFDIFGSRNLLDIVSIITGEENINNKIISSSLESQFSATIIPKTSTLSNFSALQKQIITTDFRKSFRNNDNRGNTLIVDMMGERNNIVNYNNSKITLNSENKLYIDQNNLNIMSLENRVKSIPSLINRFITSSEKYEKVIICEFYLTNYYLDQDNMIQLNPNQYSINKVNALLKTFYDTLKFSKHNFVFISFDNLYSDNHSSSNICPWIYSDFTKHAIDKKLINLI